MVGPNMRGKDIVRTDVSLEIQGTYVQQSTCASPLCCGSEVDIGTRQIG